MLSDNDAFSNLKQEVIGGPWPAEGRLAAVDFGTARMGIAVCDPSRQWTSPLETYQVRNADQDRLHFRRVAEQHGVLGWIVGMPNHNDGRESESSRRVRTFAMSLSQWTGLPVRLFDERYTTKLADRMLMEAPLTARGRKRRVDAVAAHLILEHFLENERAIEQYREDRRPPEQAE